MEKLHPGFKWSRRIGAIFATIFIAVWLSLFIGGASKSIGAGIGAFFTILILGILFNELIIGLAYANWKYQFTDDVFKMEHGIIFKTYKSIPYARIQNIDIRRGILARILGYSTVLLQTAGYSAWGRHPGAHMAEGYLPAVSVAKAEHIRDMIMKKISKRK